VGAWRLRTDHLGRRPWQGEAPSATSAATPWRGRDRFSGAGSGRRRRAACDARAAGGGMHETEMRSHGPATSPRRRMIRFHGACTAGPGRTWLRRREPGLAAPGARCCAGSPRGVWSPLPRQLVGGRDPRRWLARRRLPATRGQPHPRAGSRRQIPASPPVARGQLTVVPVRRASSSATAIQARSSDPASEGWSGEQGWGRRFGGGGAGERG